jgi:hypothetical protein
MRDSIKNAYLQGQSDGAALQEQAPPVVQVQPGAYADSQKIGRLAGEEVVNAYNTSGVGRAIHEGVRGAAATNVAVLADTAGAVGGALRPVGNFISNVATGEDMASARPSQPATARPTPQQAAPTQRVAYVPAKDSQAANQNPTYQPTAPEEGTVGPRLMDATGKDVGGGITRFDVPGKSPLFTNRTDAAGLADNEKLISRGAPTAQNQAAMDGLQARQDARDQGMRNKMQYDAEVSAANATNIANLDLAEKAHQRATSAQSRQAADVAISSRYNTPQQRIAAMEHLRSLNRGDENREAAISTGQRQDSINAVTQRGQDVQERGHQATERHLSAQDRVSAADYNLRAAAEGRNVTQFDAAQRHQKTIENLYDSYNKAPPGASREAIAENLRVMTGKDKPAHWKVLALQGGTDSLGNRIEGVLAAANEQTGEIRREKQDGVSKAPMDNHVNALRSNPSLAAKFNQTYGPGAAEKILKAK